MNTVTHLPTRKKITAWVNITLQLLYPLGLSFSPAIYAAHPAETHSASMLSARTQPYVLKTGETTLTVAKSYHLTLAELKTVNQFRVFSKPFGHLQPGDEIDVPLITKKTYATLPGRDRERDEKIAVGVQQAGTPGAEISQGNARNYVTGMAKGKITSAATQEVERWLGLYGTARVQLNTDNHLKLDGSALDVLVPLYDNPSDMFLTQLGARHTNARTTLNAGLGIRLFRDDWMYGMSTFLDNDITGRNHRLGTSPAILLIMTNVRRTGLT